MECRTLIHPSYRSRRRKSRRPYAHSSGVDGNGSGASVVCRLHDRLKSADRRDRRTSRHVNSTTVPIEPNCTVCSRICVSDFGLRSHLRSHKSSQTVDGRLQGRQSEWCTRQTDARTKQCECSANAIRVSMTVAEHDDIRPLTSCSIPFPR